MARSSDSFFLLAILKDKTFQAREIRRVIAFATRMASVLGRWIVMMMIVNVVVTTLISMYIIRKLGQPLLAVKRALLEIGQGNLDVRLRADDTKEFSDVCDALQSAVNSINQKIAEAKGEMAAIQDIQQQPAANADELSESLANCRQALDYFTTANASS